MPKPQSQLRRYLLKLYFEWKRWLGTGLGPELGVRVFSSFHFWSGEVFVEAVGPHWINRGCYGGSRQLGYRRLLMPLIARLTQKVII